MIEDFKRRPRTPSKKKRISNINRVLRLSIWICLLTSSSMVIVCALLYLSSSDVFSVRTISVTGLEHVSVDEALALADLEEGDNILAWNIQTASARLLEHPWISTVAIKRHLLPPAARISVEEHQPQATLILADARYLISRQGKIFTTAPAEPQGLQIHATAWSGSEAGDELEDILRQALAAVQLIEQKDLAPLDLNIEAGGRMNIRLKAGINLEFIGELAPERIDMARLALDRFHPGSGTVMDLTCANKIVLKNRRTHGL